METTAATYRHIRDADRLHGVEARGGTLTPAQIRGATDLWRSHLPAQLPAVAGVELAARYVAGEAGGLGGDWYDMFTLPSGWLCIVVGDVVGRGLRASAVMGRLRTALRAYALEADDPADVLGKLSRGVQHFEPDMMATVLYAKLDPSFSRLQLSSAGHPPPVLALRNRPAALLDVPPDPPVGVPWGRRRRTSVIDIEPGALVCFYTDGLVERRGRPIDVGLERLRESVVADPPDSVCSTVMDDLVGENGTSDDIVVLALRRQELDADSLLPGHTGITGVH